MVINSFTLFILLLLLLLPTILLERLFLGSIQNRFGPNVSGLFGLLQSGIDGFKTFFKQILLIKLLLKFNFIFLPIVSLLINFVRVVISPFSQTVEIFDFMFDILLFYLLSGLDALILILAIFSIFKSAFSKLSITREITQLCTLEIIMGICFLIVAVVAGTTNIRRCMVGQNSLWFITTLTPFALLFLIASLGGLHRIPFDTVEAEAELTAGYQTEFGGLLFSLFYLSEYLGIIVSSNLFISLFLNGSRFTICGSFSTVLKTSLIVVLIIFIRAVLPRIRIQSIFYVAWMYWIPVLTGLFLFYIFLLVLIESTAVNSSISFNKLC